MKILQISFHTAPFGTAGKYDSGGLNVYVEKISEQLSKNNDVTVVTAEKSESFIKDNAQFFEDVGAKAVQGQAYLPGSDEK